ncbi:MAG: putative O-methyltransferase [Phycisphaerales bacterium]|nr:putative O-methyltransferase [Phycisphaerales bacterium]
MVPMTVALAAQIDELEKLAKTRTDAMQVPRAEAELLASLALVHNAKLIVEIGTSYGFSGLWWAAALAVTGGHLHTIDVSEKKYRSSKATFAAAGVADRITNHIGFANEILPTIPGVIDLVFIDADKPSAQAYFDLVWPKLRIGGSVLTDNVISHHNELAQYVRDLRAREDAHSVTVPLGGGLEWTTKLR